MDSALDSVISYLLLLSHDSWSLLHSSLPAYSELQTIARTLVSDTTLSDDTLIKRAREHLRVFKLPQCAKYNYPRWIATRLVPSLSSQPDRVRAVTAERTFDALIQTAKDLDLGIGLRYPPAEICACAQLLAPFGSDPLPERLAAELHALIFSVWWDALWAPVLDTSMPDILNPCARFPRKTVKEVLRRENTCFMSGIPAVVRKPATCIRMFASDKIENLDIAPIFTREVSDPMTFLPEGAPLDTYGWNTVGGNDYRALQFYRTYGQIADDTSVSKVSMPQNCLLLEHKAHLAFRLFKWTLVATETPNRYKIRTYASPEQCLGTEHIDDCVTFTEPAGHPGTLPNPDLLRVHAILANVLHLSGLDFMLDPEWWARELRTEKMDVMRLSQVVSARLECNLRRAQLRK